MAISFASCKRIFATYIHIYIYIWLRKVSQVQEKNTIYNGQDINTEAIQTREERGGGGSSYRGKDLSVPTCPAAQQARADLSLTHSPSLSLIHPLSLTHTISLFIAPSRSLPTAAVLYLHTGR